MRFEIRLSSSDLENALIAELERSFSNSEAISRLSRARDYFESAPNGIASICCCSIVACGASTSLHCPMSTALSNRFRRPIMNEDDLQINGRSNHLSKSMRPESSPFHSEQSWHGTQLNRAAA